MKGVVGSCYGLGFRRRQGGALSSPFQVIFLCATPSCFLLRITLLRLVDDGGVEMCAAEGWSWAGGWFAALMV